MYSIVGYITTYVHGKVFVKENTVNGLTLIQAYRKAKAFKKCFDDCSVSIVRMSDARFQYIPEELTVKSF